MPLYRTRSAFEIARNLKCFLNLDVGVTRGQVPQENAHTKQQVQKLRRQLKNTRQELSRVREQLSKKGKHSNQSTNTSNEQDGIVYDGILLPPVNLRPTQRGRQGEKIYFEATREEVDWMVKNLGLSPKSSFLDLGCGSGRTALGILDRVGEIRKYRGVDVNKRFLGWAWRHITPEHPNFQFVHLNLRNDYYNPQGGEIGPDFTLPLGEKEFDIICLFSVFTHMLTDDVRAYLREFHRVLQDDGIVFLTANLEDDVPEVSENPIGYRGKYEYRNPLATVRYNRTFFEDLLDECGFRLAAYHPEINRGQRCLTISKKAQRNGSDQRRNVRGADPAIRDVREAEPDARQFKERNLKYRAEIKDIARDYLLLKMPHGGACAEIGMDEGDFSNKIMEQNEPEKLHLIDPWQHMEEFPDLRFSGPGGQQKMDAKYEKVTERFANEIESGQVVINRATSEAAMKDFSENYLDWLYLDANHLYSFVRQDLVMWWPKIKPGGYLTGDDYGIKGWWEGGVTAAVDEFVSEHGLELEVKFTQFLIHKPN